MTLKSNEHTCKTEKKKKKKKKKKMGDQQKSLNLFMDPMCINYM